MKRRGGLSLVLLLMASLIMPARAEVPPDCPATKPVSELQRGMTGEGRTVSSGRTIETFSAEVLGVLPNGVGPGRDMIVIEAHSPAIDAVGGIWFGMSGSPVYIDGKLIGAVAFGLSGGPSPIAGVTPAQNMLDLMSYSSEPRGFAPRRVLLPHEMKREIASRQGTEPSEVGHLTRLLLPLSISGLSGHAFEQVAGMIVNEKVGLAPYPGGSRQGGLPAPSPPADLVPGSSFASVISYGDITTAGIGTTTIVCGGRAIAFGHPFSFAPQGSTILGANLADALAVVDDDFGPYKLANVAEGIGTVDQDRFAGVRATLGSNPSTIPVIAAVSSPDTERSRTGESRVVASEFVPGVAFAHVLGNIDMTFDQIGEGSSSLQWTISGTKEDGSPWQLSRSNLYASEFDISIDSVFELQSQLFSLYFNEFDDISFTRVDVSASVNDELMLYTISKVEAAVGDAPLRETRKIRARPGATINLRITLESKTGDTDKVVDMDLRLPAKTRSDAFIDIVGGREEQFTGDCFFEGADCFDPNVGKIGSFEEMLISMQEKPTNNDLIARIFTRGFRPKVTETVSLDQVVGGFANIRVRVITGRNCCGPK